MRSKFMIWFMLVFFCLYVYGLTKMTSVNIVNSQLNNSPVGNVTPSTGAFTTLSSSSLGVSGNATVGGTLVVTGGTAVGSLSTGNATIGSLSSTSIGTTNATISGTATIGGANITSAAISGSITEPTVATSDNSTNAATTAWMNNFFTAHFQEVILGPQSCAGGAETKCSIGPFNWPSAFSDASYSLTCTYGIVTGGSNAGMYGPYINTKSASSFSLVIQTGSASAAGNNTTAQIDCTGVHP